MVFEALVLQTVGELTLIMLAKCMYDGDILGEVDCVFDLGVKLAVEWDGGYRHTEDRIDNDVRKTMRILEKDPEIHVVRIRVGAPYIEQLEGMDRCIVIHVPLDATPVEAMHVFAAAVRPILPESYSSRLENIPPTQDRAVIEVVNLRYACDRAFKEAFFCKKHGFD